MSNTIYVKQADGSYKKVTYVEKETGGHLSLQALLPLRGEAGAIILTVRLVRLVLRVREAKTERHLRKELITLMAKLVLLVLLVLLVREVLQGPLVRVALMALLVLLVSEVLLVSLERVALMVLLVPLVLLAHADRSVVQVVEALWDLKAQLVAVAVLN